MNMNIENITKAELELLVEAVIEFDPRPDRSIMLELAEKAKEAGCKTITDANRWIKPHMAKIELEADRRKIAVLQLKMKLQEVLARAVEFEVPDPVAK